MRMRLRHQLPERLEVLRGLVWHDNPKPHMFGNGIHLEIGSGKGGFIIGNAKANPDINYVGMDKVSNVIVLAIERTHGEALTNLRFIIGDALLVEDYFAPNSIDTVYLNFSDPWPKKKHEKKRLTSSDYLHRYRNLLSRGGMVKLRTDNDGFFEYSLSQFESCGYRILDVNRDAHHEIMTEYEMNFVNMGISIKSVTCDLK